MKKILIIIALALLAGYIVFGLRRGEPTVSNTSNGPAFVVNVVKPRMARPLFGILPAKLEEKLEGNSEKYFDHTSPGARVISIGQNRLELSADGWGLLIETSSEGKIASKTYLVYTREISEKLYRLRCRPADQPTGYLRATARAGSDLIDGSFMVEIASCQNDETGRVIEWPPAPLTVRGSFKGLPQNPR